MPTRASAAATPAVPTHSQALADAVTAARHAPSLRGVQPWRWELADDRLDLLDNRDPTRRTDVADSRLTLLSCGAALHHALISLAADGWEATVSRLPAGSGPGHLARVHLDRRIRAQPAAEQRLRMILARREAAGPAANVPVDAHKLRSLTSAAESEGARLQVLRPDEVLDLVIASRRIPGPRIEEAPGDSMLARSQNRTMRLAVLYGLRERRVDWLRAGEALSALWIAATARALSVAPVLGGGETAGAGEVMRRRVSGQCHPYLLLGFAEMVPARHARSS